MYQLKTKSIDWLRTDARVAGTFRRITAAGNIEVTDGFGRTVTAPLTDSIRGEVEALQPGDRLIIRSRGFTVDPGLKHVPDLRIFRTPGEEVGLPAPKPPELPPMTAEERRAYKWMFGRDAENPHVPEGPTVLDLAAKIDRLEAEIGRLKRK